MPSLNRFPPYMIAGCVLFMITFYYVVNLRQKITDLERNVNVFKESLAVSKEKNKVLVKDALEKIDKKDARIKRLEEENLTKHTKLGQTQAKLAELKSQLESKKEEIKKLHKLAADHQAEISTLTKSVSESKGVLAKLSGKAEHLMSDHTKLKKENAKLQQENENLLREIKQHQSERSALDKQLNAMKTEKEDLAIKFDDMTRKNQAIQESIKQKIKESYAAHRLRTQRDVKEPEDVQPKRKDTPKQPAETEQTDSQVAENLGKRSDENRVPDVIADNSYKYQNNASTTMINNPKNLNISRIMVNNNPENTQNNISRVLVDNGEDRDKRAAISHSKDENFDGENLNTLTRSEDNDNINGNPENTQNNISRVLVDNGEDRDERAAISHSKDENFDGENLNTLTRSEDNDNINGENLRERKDQGMFDKLRDAVHAFPELPKIGEETINVEPQVYGGVQDDSRPDSDDKIDS